MYHFNSCNLYNTCLPQVVETSIEEFNALLDKLANEEERNKIRDLRRKGKNRQVHHNTQVTADVCSKSKKLTEWGYASMFLHHIIDQKMHVSKSERQPFAQEAPWVPQVSPKGPKFWPQKFSHTIPR